jgi:hypothetical protein
MSDFHDRIELIRRILYLCRLAQEGKQWARAEMRVEVKRLREAYGTRYMTPDELATRMFEHNRKKKEERALQGSKE